MLLECAEHRFDFEHLFCTLPLSQSCARLSKKNRGRLTIKVAGWVIEGILDHLIKLHHFCLQFDYGNICLPVETSSDGPCEPFGTGDSACCDC